jgi:hypothetical protein
MSVSEISRRVFIRSAALGGLAIVAIVGKSVFASNPTEVLATNFGKPKSLFEKFPTERVFIAPVGPPGHNKRDIS